MNDSDETGSTPTPEQILRERYARGDIDDEEYLRRHQLLARTENDGDKM